MKAPAVREGERKQADLKECTRFFVRSLANLHNITRRMAKMPKNFTLIDSWKKMLNTGQRCSDRNSASYFHAIAAFLIHTLSFSCDTVLSHLNCIMAAQKMEYFQKK